MEKYLKLFIIAILASCTCVLAGCGDSDDDAPSAAVSSSKFLLGGRTLYLHGGRSLTVEDSPSNAVLSNAELAGKMQVEFQLYTSADVLDAMYPVAEIGIEIEPFDVKNASKGTKLKVIGSSRYSFVVRNLDDEFFGYDSNNKIYYIEESGSLTFEGYNSTTNVATISVNATAVSDDSESIKLQGTVLCDYDNHGLTTATW